MNDIDFIRLAAMRVLPICMQESPTPVKYAVEIAYELLKECQKLEKEENL